MKIDRALLLLIKSLARSKYLSLPSGVRLLGDRGTPIEGAPELQNDEIVVLSYLDAIAGLLYSKGLLKEELTVNVEHADSDPEVEHQDWTETEEESSQ